MTRVISPITAPDDLLPQLERIQMRRGFRAVQLLPYSEPNQQDTDQILRIVTNGAGPRLLPYLGDPMKAIIGKFADDPLWDDFLEAMQENRERESQGYAD